MKRAGKVGRIGLITLAILVAAGAQAALNIQVGDSVAISGGIDGNLATTGSVGWQNGSGFTWENCYAGVFSVTATTHGESAVISTFCTDVGVNWSGGGIFTAKDFAASDSTGVNPKWSAVPESIQNASWIYNTEFIGHTLNADQAAGIQLAIWKVLYDTQSGGLLTTSSFGSGNLQATGFGNGIVAAAGYLTDLLNARANNTFVAYTSTWLKPDGNTQGLIWTPQTPSENVPVPEPTTMIAGALLLLPFGASTIRILRKRVA